MEYYFAPMEGITSYIFRAAHHKYFPGVDKYYMPFLSPTQDHLITPREWKELDPAHNEGVNVVPQMLTKRAADFIWAAGEVASLGYKEVNLNLGCPSGTVVAKGKGSGFLRDPAALEDFFKEVFDAGLPINVSVKTRLGVKGPEEFEEILDIYNQFPISQLTIHPRVKTDLYRGRPRMEPFEKALENCKLPLCYNGDLVDAQQCADLPQKYPKVEALMMGRGLIADPALANKAKGGKGADREAIGAFLEEVYRNYAAAFGSDRNAMLRMKELWFYLINLFEDGGKLGKQLKKVSDPREYEYLCKEIVTKLPLREQLERDVFLK